MTQVGSPQNIPLIGDFPSRRENGTSSDPRYNRLLELTNQSLAGPQNLRTWREHAEAKAKSDPGSVESLQVAAFSFLERHLREHVGIPQGEEVRVEFNPKRTRPVKEDSSTEPALVSVALNDLYPEFNGAGSMRVISLYENPRLRVDQGYSSIVTVCVDYLHDRWCVSAVMLWAGPDSKQQSAFDLFLPKKDMQGLEASQMPAYKNVLSTEYPAPQSPKQSV